MKKLFTLTMAFMALTGSSAFATSGTWNASPTDGNWVSTGSENNWSNGVAANPGSTTGTTNTDVATFLSSSTTAININSGTLNIKGITFGATGTAFSAYTIGSTTGSSLFLSSGGTIQILADTASTGITETINAPLVLEGSYTFTNANADATNVLNIGGTITNGTSGAITLSLGASGGNNTGQNTISGVISDGTAGGATTALTSTTGTWALSGANTFSGGVTLGRGTLDVDNAQALGTGTLTIGNTSTFDNTSSGAITINNNAINFAGVTTFIGTQSLNLGTGAVTLTGTAGVTVDANTLTIGGIISGAHTFAKSGAGTLIFSGANTFTGQTSITAGILDYQNGTAFGTNGTISLTGGTIQVQGGIAGGSQALTLNGAGASNATGALENVSGNNSYAGAISLASATTISSDSGTLTLTGNIGTTNVLTKAGNGTLALSGTNSYATATLAAGTVLAGSNTAMGAGMTTLGNASTTTNNSNVTLLTNGAVTLANTIDIANQATSGIYTLGGNTDSNSIFSGQIQDFQSFTVTQVATTGSDTLTLSGGIRGEGSGATVIANFDNVGAVNVSGNIINSTAASGSVQAITQSGTGTTTLSGSNNTYTGATLVTGGTLNVTGTLTASAVTVGNNTAASAMLSGTGTIDQLVTTSTTGSNIAYIAPGVNTAGGFGGVGTLNLGTAGLTLGAGTNLDFDLNTSNAVGGTSNDLIKMAGGTLTIGGVLTVNYDAISSLTTGVSYVLIEGASTITGFNASDIDSTGLNGMTATYSTSGGELVVTFSSSGGSTPTTAYFTGSSSTDLTSASNYVSSPTGGTISGAPGATTDVYITANTGTTGANALDPDTNTGALSVKGLFFTGTGTPATASVTLSGSNALTTGSDGITVETGAGNDTISAPVVLGASQTWTVTDASNTLTVSGAVSGSGESLTTAGAGGVAVTGNNTYTGGTIISSGTFYADSATSSTGTGAVSVSSGGTLSGTGIIAPTGGNGITVANGGTLAPGSGQSVPYAGTPGTLASTGLTVANAAPVTLSAGAKLTFALGASNTSSAMSVLGSTVTFNNNVVTINDLVGAGLTVDQKYILFAGNSSTVYDGLTTTETANGDLITGGLSLVSTTPGTNFFSDYYGTSQLYLVGDDIEVEVIPEPGTWALMLGGFVLLIVYQRKRSR